MKRLIATVVFLVIPLSYATPFEVINEGFDGLTGIIGVLAPICQAAAESGAIGGGLGEAGGQIGGDLGEALGEIGGVIETIGGTTTLEVLCEVYEVTLRAETVVESMGDSLDTFMASAFEEGYELLSEHIGADTDLGVLEQQINGIANSIGEGASLKEAFTAAGHTLAAQKLRAVLAPATAPVGSFERLVEDNRRLSPGVLSAEIQSVEDAVEVQSRSAATADLAQRSSRLAQGSLVRGDEEQLALNVTSPNPLDQGIADKATERGANAVSSRAAIQVMIEFQADAARQQALETTTLLTSIKEMGLQQAYTNQQLSNVANALYSEQLEEHNDWRAEHLKTLEENFDKARQVEDMFEMTAMVVGTVGEAFGAEEEAP